MHRIAVVHLVFLQSVQRDTRRNIRDLGFEDLDSSQDAGRHICDYRSWNFGGASAFRDIHGDSELEGSADTVVPVAIQPNG